MCISDRFRKADVRPGIFGISAGGSRFETWFAMKMHAVFAGTNSASFYLNANARKKVPRPDNHLRRVVKWQHVARNDRPGNENDRRRDP